MFAGPEKLPKAKELLSVIFNLGFNVPEMPNNWPPTSRDRNDDPFLWATVTGKAEYLISNDRRHLLNLRSFKGIPIGTPKQFFQWAKATYPM